MFGIKFGGAKKRDEPEGVYLTARLNARVQPIDRGDHFEDPLHDALEKAGIGAVTGGGTQLAEEPAGIEYCDLEVRVSDLSDVNLKAITDKLEDLGAPKGSKLILDANGPNSEGREIPFGKFEGIGVFLDGQDLPEEVYEQSDINHVIEEMERLMGEKGDFRGYWEGSNEVALYCYGPSFEAMRDAIQPFLNEYPLCQGARVEQIA
ncbi:MAG: hypothetical protein HKN14_12345 [Marinicaulis sp.]|nr:hypothetical protein [Marinicaulis sp.]NNE41693.1 hypothetical protein [Marinicaulis sp.]NNL88990.1 hypothetical protein [Marinicaulis sp.]